MNIKSSYIARWALPNEGIPIYLIWDNFDDFEVIKINRPSDVVIRDYYNVKKPRQNMELVNKNELSSIGYIGFVLSAPIMEEITRDIKITIEFLSSGKTAYSYNFETRIVRPKIEIESLDVSMVNSKETMIDLKFKYTGYGNLYGKLIVSNKSGDMFLDVKEFRDLSLIFVNSVSFKQFLKEYQVLDDLINVDDLPDDQYEFREYLMDTLNIKKYTVSEFLEAINEVVENRKLMSILEKKIEEPLDMARNIFESIMDLVEKRPIEDVFILNSGIKQVELDEKEKRLFINLCYVDDIGNLYRLHKDVLITKNDTKLLYVDPKWKRNAGDWNWLKK